MFKLSYVDRILSWLGLMSFRETAPITSTTYGS